jgi:phage shock protein C
MALHCSNCGKALGEDARFCSACGQQIANPSAGAPFAYRPGLMRARAGRKIAGICQGFANHMGWDVTLLRVIAVVLAIVTFPLGIVVYLIAWLIMPEEPLSLPPATPVSSAV